MYALVVGSNKIVSYRMRYWLLSIFSLWAPPSAADDFLQLQIPLHSRGTQTLYVDAIVHGAGQSNLLVDTGSGHSVINQNTLSRLTASGNAHFLRNLKGTMADGATRVVPLYRIPAITLGGYCLISDIEAVVFPDNSRQILGISTLRKAAPFSFSFNPPTLSLSGCKHPIAQLVPEQITKPVGLSPVKQELDTDPAEAPLAAIPSEG
jgi:hypothetical protein